MPMCKTEYTNISGQIQYLKFDPGVEHSGQDQVLLLNQRLEVGVEARAQGLGEVGVAGDTGLQSLIQANQ